MDQPRRYVFTGNCSGLSFHIRRPVDAVLPVQAASSLPVTGGLSESRVGPGFLQKPNCPDRYVTFESASTIARGEYIDADLAAAMTRNEVPFDAVPTLTTATSEVTGLVVLGRVAIDLARMCMQAQSAADDGEPPIRCEGTRLEGVRVDGYAVRVTLADEYFREYDTQSKLAKAAGEGEKPQLFFKANVAAQYGYPNSTGITKCTAVSELAWDGAPNPNATIDRNSIIIANFGKVYFGEMFVTSRSRRLTMVRFQLDGEDGGEGSAAGGETNGNPWPPTEP